MQREVAYASEKASAASAQRGSWRDSVLQLGPAPTPIAAAPVAAVPTIATPPPEPRRRPPGRLIVTHILDLVGLVLLAAVASVLRFGQLYLIYPQLQGVGGLCLSLAYRLPLRTPAIAVPDYAIYILVILAPLVSLGLLEVVLAFAVRKDRTKSAWSASFFKRLSKLTLLFLLGLCLTSSVADLLRLLFSRPRPYFLANDDFGYGFARYCKPGVIEDRAIGLERNARLSFPSHRCTMLAFCGVLVAVHAERVLRRVVAGGMYAARVVVALVCAAPALVLASQAYDSRTNHWEDIAVGLLLGAALGTYVAQVLCRDLAKEMQEASAPARPRVQDRPAPEAVNRAHSYYTWKDAQAHRTSDDAYF